MAPTITARETKVAVNDMTRVRLMESPGPGHGHRGFLMQRNHESGGIVIVYSVPEECGFGNSAISTFCNRDIFAIPNSAGVIFIRPRADNRPVPQSPRERSALRERNHHRKRGMFFRPQRVSPDIGVPGLSD